MFLQSSFVLRTLEHNGNTAPFYRGGVSYAIIKNEKGRLPPPCLGGKKGQSRRDSYKGMRKMYGKAVRNISPKLFV